MKRWFIYKKTTIILIVLAVLLVSPTVLSALGSSWKEHSPDDSAININHETTVAPEETTTLRPIMMHTNVPMITEEVTRPMTPPITTTSTTTTESTTSTTSTTPFIPDTAVPPSGHFTHIAVFIDRQIVVMYHSNKVYSRAFYCSTGRAGHRTPITEGSNPFTIRYPYGIRYNDKADYVKWDLSYVRYPTQFYKPKYYGLFFHSIPYHLEGGFNKANLKTTHAYRMLGRSPLSLGCVRMSLRDAKFLHHNSRPNMPVYIYSSSKGHSIPTPAWLPPVKYSTWDPTDTDPRSPYMRGISLHTVRYDANNATGGKVPVDSGKYIAGTVITLKEPGSLVKEGYDFVGWSLNKTPGQGEQLKPPGSGLPITQSVTLYAQWKPIGTTPNEPTEPADPLPTGPVEPSDPLSTGPTEPLDPPPTDPTEPTESVPTDPAAPSDPPSTEPTPVTTLPPDSGD